jgi:hypothetical protein
MYKTVFFTDVVMPGLINNITSKCWGKTLKGWMIRMDNARPHNMRLSQECIDTSTAGRLPHPAYSPDITPSDFLLFGHIKMSDYNSASRRDFLNTIADIFSQIDKAMLKCVFESRIER